MKWYFIQTSEKSVADRFSTMCKTHLLHRELNSLWLILQKNIHENGTHRGVQSAQLHKQINNSQVFTVPQATSRACSNRAERSLRAGKFYLDDSLMSL